MLESKIFYNISEVSETTDLPKYVIRFWEKEFSELAPKRNNGRRLYKEQDIKLIQFIKDLLYKKGFTIKGAKKFLSENKTKDEKLFSNFKINEEKGQLEPIQNSKILKRFSFSSDTNLKITDDFSSIIKRLSELEEFLKS